MNPDLIIRRLGVTLVLAILFACFIALFCEGVAGVLFLPSWGLLFFGWPYLSRKLNFNFPKPPAKGRSANIGLLVVTFWLASLLCVGIARSLDSGDLAAMAFMPLWFGTYYGWSYLDRKLTLTPKIVLVLVCLSSIVVVPIALTCWRAQTVSDSIHIGMKVPEVLHTVKDCDLFQAYSDYAYRRNRDGDNIPSVHLSWRNDTYQTYDYATGQFVQLTESQAIERLHTKLHDGSKWTFQYTYVKVTPMQLSFRVIFGPDGRVSEVHGIFAQRAAH